MFKETIDEIKSLMKSGDFAGAEALCRKALETEPDNAAVKMLYATCRNLQGDEETFRRIMLEIAPQMEALAKAAPDSEAAKLWRKSGAVLMEYVVLGVLLVAAVVGGVIVLGNRVPTGHLYAAPILMTLYAGPTEIVTNVIEEASVISGGRYP